MGPQAIGSKVSHLLIVIGEKKNYYEPVMREMQNINGMINHLDTQIQICTNEDPSVSMVHSMSPKLYTGCTGNKNEHNILKNKKRTRK